MRSNRPGEAPVKRSKQLGTTPIEPPKQTKGAAAFEAYYAALFGDRWQALRTALLQETQPVAFSVRGGKPYYLDQASIYAAQALPPIDEGSYLDMCAAPGGKTLVLASRMGERGGRGCLPSLTNTCRRTLNPASKLPAMMPLLSPVTGKRVTTAFYWMRPVLRSAT